MNQYEVYCENLLYRRELNFYIIKHNVDGSRSCCKSLDTLEFVQLLDNEEIPPTFTIGGHITKPFLQAMANMIKEAGIVAEGDPINQNELIAVKYHLEDMRNLVFKPNK